MHVLPQALPVVQTLQHDGPDESLPQPVVSDGPLADTSVKASAAGRRAFLQIQRIQRM